MEIPLQITAKGIKLEKWAEDDIREKANGLDKYYNRITRCRVSVEVPHRHRHEGAQYLVHIYMTVPDGELMVKREPAEELEVAVRDAFDAARRKLEDYIRVMRHDVKHHEEAPKAKVASIFPERGYGFLVTQDGSEIYFHEHSVLKKKFKQLKVGSQVRFVEEMGEKGPQASTVYAE